MKFIDWIDVFAVLGFASIVGVGIGEILRTILSMTWLDWLLSMFHPRPAPKPAPVTPVVASGLIAALNVERVRYGLAPFKESPALTTSAIAWAKSMAARGFLTHGDFVMRISAVVPGRAAAEDIAEGQASVAQVVSNWMASTGHRANILGPYTQAGHGEATRANGVTYWVVDFAS